MMGRKSIIQTLDRLSYKGRGSEAFKVKTVMFDDKVSYDISVNIVIKDRVSEEETTLYSHYTYHPSELRILTPAAVIRRVRSMLIYLESHEVDEQLLMDGRRVFDPHSQQLSGPRVAKEKMLHKEKIDGLKKHVLSKLKGL